MLFPEFQSNDIENYQTYVISTLQKFHCCKMAEKGPRTLIESLRTPHQNNEENVIFGGLEISSTH